MLFVTAGFEQCAASLHFMKLIEKPMGLCVNVEKNILFGTLSIEIIILFDGMYRKKYDHQSSNR